MTVHTRIIRSKGVHNPRSRSDFNIFYIYIFVVSEGARTLVTAPYLVP
jgi:hypothetical protein